MVLDSSAILAIVFDEPDAEEFVQKIAAAAQLHVSAATLLEVSAVLIHRSKARDDRDLMTFLEAIKPDVVPFDHRQYSIAREAFQRYGRSTGHRARLNFGDCFAYALAKHLDTPLLFKGGDFIHTDLVPA